MFFEFSYPPERFTERSDRMPNVTPKFLAGNVCTFTSRGVFVGRKYDGKRCVIVYVKNQSEWMSICEPEYIVEFFDGIRYRVWESELDSFSES